MEIQRIDCEVTFLRNTENGELPWPKTLSGGRYRPHLVVGDLNQRRAFVTSGMVPVTFADGKPGELWSDKILSEEYLGVMFDSGPDNPELDTPLNVTLILMFWPETDYKWARSRSDLHHSRGRDDCWFWEGSAMASK